MATQEQLFQALRNADAAGDTAAAKRFAQLIQQSRQGQEAPSAEEQMAQAIESGEVDIIGDAARSRAGFLGVEGSLTAHLPGAERKYTRSELAEQTGVDTETGAPGRVRMGASTSSGTGLFTSDASIRQENVATLLRDAYGQDVATRTGPVSGELEFQNPETGQWTLFDEEGITGRDVADLAGDAVVIGGEALGATGGALAGSLLGPGGTVAGGLAGAAAGAAGGEYARQKLGQAFYGTNEDVSDAQMLGSAAEVGAITALVGPLLRGGYAVGRNFKRRFTGNPPEQEVATLLQSPESVAELKRGLEQTIRTNRRLAEQEGDDAAAQVLAQLDQKLAANGYDLRSLSKQEAEALWANSRYQPTLADLSGDADLLADQTRLMSSGPSTARPLRNQREAGYGVLQRGMQNAAEAPTQDKAQLSRNIAGTVVDRANRNISRLTGRSERLLNLARQRTEGAASRVDDLRQPLPENASVDQRALGQDVRENMLETERERRLGEARSMYDDLSTPNVEVTPTRLRGTMQSVKAEAGRSKMASQRAGSTSRADELLRNTQRAPGQGKGSGLRTQGDGVSSRFSAQSLAERSGADRQATIKTMSGDEAIETLKDIKAALRNTDRGELTNADSAVFKRALASLDEDMRAAFPDDYSAAKAAVDSQYREVQDELERSLIGRVTKKKANKYVINDEFVFERLIQPGNKTDAAVFKDMLAKPEYGGQRVALRDGFAEKYAREVGKRANQGDKAFQRKHDEFLRKYGDWMEGAFTPAEMADIRKVGTAASKLQRVTQRQKEIERKVGRILGDSESRIKARTSSLVGPTDAEGAVNPDAVFDRVWGGAGMSKLRPLKEALQDSPALWEQFKARAHYDLGQKVFDAAQVRGGGVTELDGFLRKNRDYLSEAFGDQYVRDLSLVSEALKRSTASAAGREGREAGVELFRNFSRVFFAPPLSARGRAQTAVERFIGANRQEEMAKLLADPRNLRKLVSMKPLNDMTKQGFIARVLRDGVAGYAAYDAARTDATE